MSLLVDRIAEFMIGDFKKALTPQETGSPIGRVRFAENFSGRETSARQYLNVNLSRLPSSVNWQPGARIPREHHVSRGGNRKT